MSHPEPVSVSPDVLPLVPFPAAPVPAAVPGPTTSNVPPDPPHLGVRSPSRDVRPRETQTRSVEDAGSQRSCPRRETHLPSKYDDYVVKVPNLSGK